MEYLSDPVADRPHANASAHIRRLTPNGLEDLPMGRDRRAPRMSPGRALSKTPQ